MGYIKNHTIIVTTYDKEKADGAHKEAMRLFGNMVTEIKVSPVNAHYSFAILPDGSKEGWDESSKFDDLRNIFRKYVEKQRFEDNSNALEVVEVWFDEEDKAGIVWNE